MGLKKLPDAEFEVMKAVWVWEGPVTTNAVMERLKKEWKAQTVVTLLQRLADRGFLRSEKPGKERLYYPLIAKEEYLKFETGSFLRQYHDNSLLQLVNTLYADEALGDEEIDELLRWVKERRG